MSHQRLRMRVGSCVLQRQREAGEEGMQQSERPAEECVHTSRSPAEQRERAEEKMSNQH